MEQINSIDDAVSTFNEIDGIEANATATGDRFLVKVNDEAAIGQFFQTCRQNGLSRTRTTRNDLENTVLDSWVSL